MWVERQPEVALALAESKGAQDTAAWIRQVLAGERAVPQALRLQLACCLVATGEAATMADAETRLQQAGI
ncbi:hypothetical protein [Pantoea sp. VS1]|uniref:hypothetical protein n=1 Tax=Pantoea sp. VS1 TaxID=2003658 RepID=UPI0020CE2CD1|nr:hypothetical protein [Pantoea sp. VS1]